MLALVDSGQLELRLWAAPGHEPRAAFTMPPEGIALTRDLLGGDPRVSRGANAIRVARAGNVSVRVRVPPGALLRPLVLQDTTLAALQCDVPPSSREWRVSPGGLGEPWTTAVADRAALGLLRAAVWNERSEVMHLLRLPRPAVIEPGCEATFVAPITIAVAGAALGVTSSLTSAPVASPGACLASFDVAPLRRALFSRAPLERLAGPPVDGAMWIPGAQHALDWQAAERAIAERAPAGANWFLLPALAEGDGATVLLAFRDNAGRWRLAGTKRDPATWIAELASSLGGDERKPFAALPVPAAAAPQPSRLALATPERFGDFVTYDAATAKVVEQLRSAAPSILSVLLLGESGTGKELLARALHEESHRKGAFVPVSCAAIPEHLMESELFGHVGGAYTGARGDRPGAFVAARGGTLFLDEIGDAPISVQLGLLRALEARKVKPVGSDHEVEVDVRVVAATSRHLDDLVRGDRFRFDLYHRIAQLAVRVPPLRDRPADVEWLAEDLLEAAAPRRKLTPRARAALVTYAWPGNVRELRNTIERAVALTGATGTLEEPDLMLQSPVPTSAPAPLRETRVVFVFPKSVIQLAERALAEGDMPKPEGLAPRRARSQQRAAFLYLRVERPNAGWSLSLKRQCQRLFRSPWATAEQGRGLAELMAVLGLHFRDKRDREQMDELLRRAELLGPP